MAVCRALRCRVVLGVGLLMGACTQSRPLTPGAVAQAESAVVAERFVEAEAMLDTLVTARPDSARWWRLRGYCRIREGRPQAALADYDRALQLRPDDVLTLHNRGMAHYELEELEKAAADYDRALLLAPDLAATYLSRGVLRVRQEQFTAARTDLERALVLGDTANSSTYNLLGYCQLRLGHPAAAVASFDRALALDSRYADARRNRAEAYQALRLPARLARSILSTFNPSPL